MSNWIFEIYQEIAIADLMKLFGAEAISAVTLLLQSVSVYFSLSFFSSLNLCDKSGTYLTLTRNFMWWIPHCFKKSSVEKFKILRCYLPAAEVLTIVVCIHIAPLQTNIQSVAFGSSCSENLNNEMHTSSFVLLVQDMCGIPSVGTWEVCACAVDSFCM